MDTQYRYRWSARVHCAANLEERRYALVVDYSVPCLPPMVHTAHSGWACCPIVLWIWLCSSTKRTKLYRVLQIYSSVRSRDRILSDLIVGSAIRVYRTRVRSPANSVVLTLICSPLLDCRVLHPLRFLQRLGHYRISALLSVTPHTPPVLLA
jgi:hypothetical protein